MVVPIVKMLYVLKILLSERFWQFSTEITIYSDSIVKRCQFCEVHAFFVYLEGSCHLF